MCYNKACGVKLIKYVWFVLVSKSKINTVQPNIEYSVTLNGPGIVSSLWFHWVSILAGEMYLEIYLDRVYIITSSLWGTLSMNLHLSVYSYELMYVKYFETEANLSVSSVVFKDVWYSMPSSAILQE